MRQAILAILGTVLLIGIPGVNADQPAAGEKKDAAPIATLSPESQRFFEEHVRPFLKQHCAKCHDVNTAKAGFIIDDLGTDFLAGKTADHWHEVIDLVNVDKMPPKKEARPDPKEAFAITEWVNSELRNAEKRAKNGGRAAMRRMNRTEYANTVRDLFHLDEEFVRKLEMDLPPDGKIDGFDRGGAALFIDRAQLQAYLDTARIVVEEAVPAERLKETVYHHEAVKDNNLVHPIRPTISMKEVLERSQQYSNLYSKGAEPEFKMIERGPDLNDFHTVRDNGVEVVVGPMYTGEHLNYLKRGDMPNKVVTRDGWYRVKLRAGADRGSGMFAVDDVRVSIRYCPEAKDFANSAVLTIDAPLDKPQVYEKLMYLRTSGPSLEKTLIVSWNTFYPAPKHPSPVLQNKELLDLTNNALQSAFAFENSKTQKAKPEVIEAARAKRDENYEKLRKFAEEFKGPVNYLNPEVDVKACPRIWFEYVDLEGPLTLEWPTKAAKEVFFDGDSKDDRAYVREIFARFLPRAYRRAVAPQEIDALVAVAQEMRDKHGKSFNDAIRSALLTVLTSPDFLFIPEPTEPGSRRLTDEALASRLSYFLWSTMPDAELFKLAAEKKLHEPAVLAAQVKRMTADPKARQFVDNFVGQWMRARDFGSVMVDMRQYNKYDESLRTATLREPYEFFAELLRNDLPVVNLLDSDFAVVNERLAQHYGIDGVKGEEFRRVALKPEHHRGGILGMAGLLTFLSDGTRTQPVKRGAYVLDVLWNTPAPLPPPNVGDLPVVKGKNLTVRQRLEQHRSVATCASCHSRIDPLGLALEHYDAIGAWRERQNGEGRKGDQHDPLIDVSGTMPDGKPFKTFDEFKGTLVENKAKFLKGFTEKLLTYALGRPVGAVDRETVETILADTAKQDDRLQAFLTAIVASQAFLNK